MSGYFRDRFQGVGAIAAARPAPRSAPAPSFGRMARRRGGTCPQGCFPIADGTCDCPSARVRAVRRGIGAIDVTGDRDAGAAGGSITSGKSPLRQIMPAATVSRPLMQSTGIGPGATIGTNPNTPIAPPPAPGTPPPPGYLPPRQPMKANTAGGGAGWSGSPAYSGGALTQMAPPENEETLPGSATTGGLPGGAAKIWLVLGLAGVGYLGYRHLKKKRRKR